MENKPANTSKLISPEMREAVNAALEKGREAEIAFSEFAEEMLNGLYSLERHLAVIALVLSKTAIKEHTLEQTEIAALYNAEK